MTIIVEIETCEGAEAELVEIMSEHAQTTLQEEPGCLRFDVVKPLGKDGEPLPNKVILCERYASEEAVAAHRANPRMELVRMAIKPLIASQRLILAKALS